jgi:hypothetical protein
MKKKRKRKKALNENKIEKKYLQILKNKTFLTERLKKKTSCI